MKSYNLVFEPTAEVIPPAKISSWVFPIVLLIASTLFSGWLGFRPIQAKPVIVFFAPSVSTPHALNLALTQGARIIRLGAFPNSLIVQSDQSDFFRRLYKSGAWLVLDAKGPSKCGSKPTLKKLEVHDDPRN